ncbi:MAG: tetratricopeptide repeat protein [Nostocales cyanobacterium]|nr:MAG: tetratricopeptide repeat protein [Nostocales cyanobacterium]TAF13719.1 MAG: tetratricopeptide repeat protein [Nostocales cyanobacterium]
MLEEVNTALERQDYQTAAKLLKPLIKKSPDDPWVHLYVAKLQEVSGKRQEAEKIYRQLLKVTINNKILSQARQGLQRLEDAEKAERKQAIAEATAEPTNAEQGILVLEPTNINSEQRTLAAKEFAKIMQIDPYSARLVLPSRAWRVYRIGKIGEMQFYGKQLQQAGISCFWLKLSHIQNIQVYQVKYFSQSSKNPHVVCTSNNNQMGSLSFSWSEVTAKVMGLLPIFEEVVDLNVRGKLERKTQTQDYAHFCDLHLPERRSILRIYDSGYDFQQGLEISPNATQNTMRINWNNLISWINENTTNTQVWSEFQPFGEGVLDQTETLNKIPANIQIYRKEKSNWDSAFHLYSGIIFTRNDESK